MVHSHGPNLFVCTRCIEHVLGQLLCCGYGHVHINRSAVVRTTGQSVGKSSSIQTLPKSSCAVLRLSLEKAGAWHPGIRIAVAVDYRCQLSASGGSSLSATAWKRRCQCLGLYAARKANCRNCSLFIFKRGDNIDSRTLTCLKGRRALRGAVGSL